MKPTLLVLAAGMGSRYGGLKQLDGLGPNNETLLEYGVYDALRAGFGKIVFIIRESFKKEFEENICSKFPSETQVVLVDQGPNLYVPEGYDTEYREKPRGTAHAVLVAKEHINEPFAVINADDYYGRSAYEEMYTFLTTRCTPSTCSIVGYTLSKTLSPYGTVNRGVCSIVDSELVGVQETLGIQEKKGKAIDSEGNEIDMEAIVSMNFRGFHQRYLEILEEQFTRFVLESDHDPRKEFYIPSSCSELITKGDISCEVLASTDMWCGVTYQEDKPYVLEILNQLINTGVYTKKLWSHAPGIQIDKIQTKKITNPQ